jgi:hypothetical protein
MSICYLLSLLIKNFNEISAGNQIETNLMPSEIIGFFDYCEENKSNNFFVGKHKIILVNNTFCFPNFISHGPKTLKTFLNNERKSLKVSKPHEKNYLLFFLNIAQKIFWNYNYAYISCQVTKIKKKHRGFAPKLYKECNLKQIILF